MNQEPNPEPIELSRDREEEFRALFERYTPRLLLWIQYRLNRSVARRLDAEDVLQDVGLVAARKFDKFEGSAPAAFYHWTLRIVEHCIRRAVKRHRATAKRNAALERDLGSLGSPSGGGFDLADSKSLTASKILERKNCASELLDLIQQLPRLQRDAIVLVKIGSFRVSEAAELLQEKPAAISLALLRGAARLRELIETHRDDHPYLRDLQPPRS